MSEATTFNVSLRKRSCRQVVNGYIIRRHEAAIPDTNLLGGQAREALWENHDTRRGKREKETMRKEPMGKQRHFPMRSLSSPPRGAVYAASAFCMEPNPRLIHSRGEARSALSPNLKEEEAKTQSLTSEKAQSEGLGAGVAVTARSSLPGEKT